MRSQTSSLVSRETERRKCRRVSQWSTLRFQSRYRARNLSNLAYRQDSQKSTALKNDEG